MAHCHYFEEVVESLTDHLPNEIVDNIKITKIYCSSYQSKKEVRAEVDVSRLSHLDFDKFLTTMSAVVVENDFNLRLSVFKDKKVLLAYSAWYDK